MSENLISWNVPNWITVTLMSVIGWLVFSLVWNVVSSAGKEGEGL